MRDVMAAMRAITLADPAVTALVAQRVYVNEIPESQIKISDTFHPPKMLVLRQSGGSAKNDLLPTDDQNVTILCYGENQKEADSVRRVIWTKFVHLARETEPVSGVCIHHINPTGGPIPLVDPDIVWPAVAQGFTVKADVKE